MKHHTPSTVVKPSVATVSAAFIGIDYHKRYSVYHVLDPEGRDLAKGRIEHHSPQDFVALVKRWPRPRVVFEACMNWHWLHEILEQAMPEENLVLANPSKTRIIAEAEVMPNPKISPRPIFARYPSPPRGPPGLRLLNLENVALPAPVSQPDPAQSQPPLAVRPSSTARLQPDLARVRSRPPPERSHPARPPTDPAPQQNDSAPSPNDPAPQQNDFARPPNRIAAPFPEATPEIPPSTDRNSAPAPQGGTPAPNRETAPGGSRAGVEWEEKRIAVIGWNCRQ